MRSALTRLCVAVAAFVGALAVHDVAGESPRWVTSHDERIVLLRLLEGPAWQSNHPDLARFRDDPDVIRELSARVERGGIFSYLLAEAFDIEVLLARVRMNAFSPDLRLHTDAFFVLCHRAVDHEMAEWCLELVDQAIETGDEHIIASALNGLGFLPPELWETPLTRVRALLPNQRIMVALWSLERQEEVKRYIAGLPPEEQVRAVHKQSFSAAMTLAPPTIWTPLGVWANRELYRLSLLYPELVAKEANRHVRLPEAETAKVNLLGEAAREIFAELRKWSPATVSCHPDVIDRKAKGKWVTCYVEFERLPFKGNPVEAVAGPETMLLDGVPAVSEPTLGWVTNPERHDSNQNGVPEYMVKFDAAAIVERYGDGDAVTLELTGDMSDRWPMLLDRHFRGQVTLRFK